VQAAEAWARAQGCTEMASDAELDNHASHAAHRRLGYAETERLVCFRKSLLASQPEEATSETTPRT
jgi:aminoglycoside 6'-N-acetyltransferase I